MVVVVVAHVFFSDCLFLLCAEGEVCVVLERGGRVLGGFLYGVTVYDFAVVLLCALDLEAADAIEVVGVTVLPLEGVLVGQLLWVGGILFGLFVRVRRVCGHRGCLLRFFELGDVGICLVLGLASCTVSHRFNLNTRRYITKIRASL